MKCSSGLAKQNLTSSVYKEKGSKIQKLSLCEEKADAGARKGKTYPRKAWEVMILEKSDRNIMNTCFETRESENAPSEELGEHSSGAELGRLLILYGRLTKVFE